MRRASLRSALRLPAGAGWRDGRAVSRRRRRRCGRVCAAPRAWPGAGTAGASAPPDPPLNTIRDHEDTDSSGPSPNYYRASTTMTSDLLRLLSCASATGCWSSSKRSSPSNRPATTRQAVDRCGAELASRLDGARRRHHARHRRPPPAITCAPASAPAIARCCCSVTSTRCGRSGSSQRMPLKRDGGRLHGPGVFDMKAGIGVATLATRAAARARARSTDARIVMLWTTDEETGSTTSRALIETEAVKSDAVLVLEPSLPGGALKTSRKGCGQYELVGHRRLGARRRRSGQGRQRHSRAGAPDSRGRNAPGSRSRHHGQRRRGPRRVARQCRGGRSARHGRRARRHDRRCRASRARDEVADSRT